MLNDKLIEQTGDILGGTPVFAGTRVPVQTLLDYLAAGDRLDDFLDDFPTVTRAQAIAVLELLKRFVLQGHDSLRVPGWKANETN
jgi:uncharacterized protein (DUF433 family)